MIPSESPKIQSPAQMHTHGVLFVQLFLVFVVPSLSWQMVGVYLSSSACRSRSRTRIDRDPAARDRDLRLVDFVCGAGDGPDRGAVDGDCHRRDLCSVPALSTPPSRQPRHTSTTSAPRNNGGGFAATSVCRARKKRGGEGTLTGPSMSKAARPRRCDSVANSSPPTVRVLSCVSITRISPGCESASAAMTCRGQPVVRCVSRNEYWQRKL